MPDGSTTAAAGKRPSGGTGPNSKAAKKARADEVPSDDVRRILAIVSDEDQVSALTVAQLKEMCKLLNLGVAGKRAELIEKLLKGAMAMMASRKDA